MEHLRFWLNSLLTNMESASEQDTVVDLIEKCGRQCAQLHAIERIRELMPSISALTDLEQVVELLKQHRVAGGNLTCQGNAIMVTYNRCYCPIINDGMVRSPFFCNCTRGWTKEVFSTVLGRPVEAELLKSIHRGDECCQIVIR